MSKFNDDWAPVKHNSISRKPSSIHQISQKGAPSREDDQSPPNNINPKRQSVSHINLMATQASVTSNMKNRQSNAQNSQKYFKNYALINEKQNQLNGNTVKDLDTSALQKEQQVLKKHVYSLDSSTMQKGRSDQEDSKIETHISLVEKFPNKHLNLKLPDYAPEHHVNYSVDQGFNYVKRLQVGRMYPEQYETSPEDNANSSINRTNMEDSIITKQPIQDFSEAMVNHKQKVAQEKQSYSQLSRKNPNLVFDVDQNLNQTLNKYLSNQKELIQRDGNIKINGILIKGAPSLGTKFNPNFRDPHHAPCARPQSRGLTQGSILQIATKALAHIQTQNLSRSQGGIRIKMPNHSCSQQYSKRDSIGAVHKRNVSQGFSQGRRFIGVRGTKKQAVEKKVPQKQQSKKNKDIAKSLNSLSCQRRQNDHITAEKVKIQGGGQDGQDKVQLNVKFNRKNQDANSKTGHQNSEGYEALTNLNESINGPINQGKRSIVHNVNSSFGRLNDTIPRNADTMLAASYLIKSESSRHRMNLAQVKSQHDSAATVPDATSKNLDGNSISNMDQVLVTRQIASNNRQSSGSFGNRTTTRDPNKNQDAKSITLKKSQQLETNDSENDIKNVKNLRINIQNLNDGQLQTSQQQHYSMQNHPKSVKEIRMQQYHQKNMSQNNLQPQKRAKTQENNTRAYRIKRIRQATQMRQMQNRTNNFSSTIQSSMQGNSQIQSATNTHNTQSLRKGKPIEDFKRQMQKLERNEDITPHFLSNTNSLNPSPVHNKTSKNNERTVSGANTGFNSGIYLQGSNIPDLNSMDNLPQRPQLSKNAQGNTSAQHYGKQGHIKSRSKPSFQNVAPKVQSRNFHKANASNEQTSQLTGQAATSLDDKFKTEKMDLTTSQQNTLRQEQSQLHKDKQLHTDRITKVTNNTVQLQNDQTFSGHGSFEMNHTNVQNTNAMPDSPKAKLEFNVQTINIGGPEDSITNKLVHVSNDDQSHDGKHMPFQSSSGGELDHNNIKRIVLTQNQLSEPQCVDNSQKLYVQSKQLTSESLIYANNSNMQASLKSPDTLKNLKNKDSLKAKEIALHQQNSPSMPGVTEYLNDSEFVDMFMKPKGIEIFNPELLSSDKASKKQSKNYINFQNFQPAQKMRSTTQKPLDPSENEPQSSIFTQSHMIDSSVKQSRQIMPDDHIGLQNSFNNSKMIQIVQQNHRSFKRFRTVNQKKKNAKQIGQNEAIDIDEKQYTEISSNANSMDKSEILNQQKFTTQKTHVTQIADLDTKSLKIVDKKQIEKIPLFNQDLKERQKLLQEQCATDLSCDPYTEINTSPNKRELDKNHTDSAVSMTEMAMKDLKISEKKFTDSINKFEHGSQKQTGGDNKNIHFRSNIQTELMSDLKNNNQTHNQSQLDKRVEKFKGKQYGLDRLMHDIQHDLKPKSRMSYNHKEEQTKSMDGKNLRELHKMSTEMRRAKQSSMATPCSKDEVTEKQNSKAFSAMISDNLLDIQEINQNYLQIDEMFSNSQDMADGPVLSAKQGPMGQLDYLENKSNRYRPIQQINVQLLSSNSNENKSSNPLNKSSIYEVRNSKQRDVGIQLSWQNSQQMQNYQEKQSNCKSEATARQCESYQKDLSQLVGGPKFSPPNSGFSKTTINQASLNMTNREANDQANVPQIVSANLVTNQSSIKQISARQSGQVEGQVEADFLDSMAEIQKQNELSMQRMQKFVESMRRKQMLFEMLYAQRRRLFKSPNPNDRTKILVGTGQELEADVLLNGSINASTFKKRDSDLGITFDDEKMMLKNQLMRQRCYSDTKKEFLLQGNFIDGSNDKVKKAFEYVHRQGVRNFTLTPNIRRSKSPQASINDSRQLLQLQLKNLPLDQLKKIHEILTAGGIIMQKEQLSKRRHSANQPVYQHLIENPNESYIQIKFKQDENQLNLDLGTKRSVDKINYQAKRRLSAQQVIDSKRSQKFTVKKLNIAEFPLGIKSKKNATQLIESSQTPVKLSDEELIRDAIVNKILCEEKTAQSIMIDGQEQKEQKLKKSVNLYQQGLNYIEDIQGSIAESIDENENQFIQYQEVGSIHNMFNSQYDQSKDATTRQLASSIKMMNIAVEESNSPFQNATQSINTPSLGFAGGLEQQSASHKKAKEEVTPDYGDKKSLDIKKLQSTLGRNTTDFKSNQRIQNSEPPSALPFKFQDHARANPLEDSTLKLKNRHQSMVGNQNVNHSSNITDFDQQTENQTIYLKQRAGSNATGGSVIQSTFANIQPKQTANTNKGTTNQNSSHHTNDKQNQNFNQLHKEQRSSNYQTQPMNITQLMSAELSGNYMSQDLGDRGAPGVQQPLKKKEQQVGYQSFGRIVPTIAIHAQDSYQENEVQMQPPNQQQPQQQIRAHGGKSSQTAMMDYGHENQSPKTFTNISYNIDPNDGNFSVQNIKEIDTSMHGSDKEQKLVLNTFNQKHIKCETNRKTLELEANDSSRLHEKLVNRSKNSVNYKILNEDLAIDMNRAHVEVEYEDMLDSSIKDLRDSRSTQMRNKKKLNVACGPNQQEESQQYPVHENHTLGSQKYSNTILADCNSPQQFNPTIYDMQRYSFEGHKSLDENIEIAQQERLKKPSPTKKSRNSQNEYNKIQRLTAEIQISKRKQFNQTNATQIDRLDRSLINDLHLQQNESFGQTYNTLKGVHCAKYLQSTCSTRPKSQGIMGSQKYGKKILHHNLANYELYMQLKHMKNVGKQIVNHVPGDNVSSEPTIRDQGTLTQHMSNATDDNQLTKTFNKEHNRAFNSDINSKRSSHLFSQVSQKMKEVFLTKQMQANGQMNENGRSVRARQNQTTKDRIQKYQGASHHRRFNTLSVEFQKQQNEKLRKQANRSKMRKNQELSSRHNQVGKDIWHGSVYTPSVTGGSSANRRPYTSSNMYDDIQTGGGCTQQNILKEKMDDNSLYKQYFDPACRLINQQRFLNKINQIREQEASKCSEYARPTKMNILKVVTPNFYEKQLNTINNVELSESERLQPQ